MIRRRHLLAAALMPAPALAQGAWPQRAVRIVAPDAAGAGNDVTIRLVAPHLEAALGRPVVIDNRPGAGGRIGVENAFRSPADGYTLLLGNAGATGINAAIYRDLPYDIERDFAPVSLLVLGPNVLVVNPRAVPARNVAHLVAWLRERPGQVNFAMTAPGGSAHMLTEMFRLRTRTDFVVVPYRGAPDMARAVVSGEAPVNFNNLVNIAPQVASGEAVVIAVTTAERSPLLPDVPTMVEQGYPGFDSAAWNGLLVPRGAPPEVTARLQSALVPLRQDAVLQERVRGLGGTLLASSPEVFATRLRNDIAMWREVVGSAGIRVE
ncbi:Bug family tripartite tricarboxylate transporter substrate binding protein [Falsiroseomonas sp. HW251]|uniref:Bug family tripartite tricarboxylate transporter substrate binding protein n=1 Tax=Falsiroseomonas sp. HW251 TaxID=3390998 RepID=UPI003D322F5D